MSTSYTDAAKALTAIYGTRTFNISTVSSMVKANILAPGPNGTGIATQPTGARGTTLQQFIANTAVGDYNTYPDPKGGLLRVSVLQKREHIIGCPDDARIERDFMGIDLDDLKYDPAAFLKGFEGIWMCTDETAQLAVDSGTHLMATFRGYTHQAMIRKIVGYTRLEGDYEGYVWFHTDTATGAVQKWIGTGLILPADSRPGVWGWAIRP